MTRLISARRRLRRSACPRESQRARALMHRRSCLLTSPLRIFRTASSLVNLTDAAKLTVVRFLGVYPPSA
jgi:hypothetical protein